MISYLVIAISINRGKSRSSSEKCMGECYPTVNMFSLTLFKKNWHKLFFLNYTTLLQVATVCEIIGKRLHIKYYDSLPDDMGFWCHEDSPLIHPVGWAFRIGHKLDAPEIYLERVAAGRLTLSDTNQDMFHKFPAHEMPLFTEGYKLEAIDPLNLSSLCAATIMQILNEGKYSPSYPYFQTLFNGSV